MTDKIVTLYIDDTSLRLMIARGKRIEKWAYLPLEPGLVENTVVIKEAEVAAKIKQLFKDQQVKTEKIAVGMSGLHCLSRPIILPQLPEVMLEEAVKREAKRVLPVPLEQLYISWQTIPAPEGKSQVFLIAIPRNTADALIKALHQAGLKPSFMDVKPLLLARVVKEATAVIVDVQKAEYDIVIMANGVPQPIRTIPSPDEALSWQEKSTTIRNELDRTIQFYNSNNPENQLASSVPIFASGDLAMEPEICQALSDELGHPVLPLPSPLECPAGFDPSRCMVNIGLTLQKLSSKKEAGSSVASLNILPTPYLPKPISLTNVLALPGAVLAVGLVAFLIMLTQSTSADIASTRDQLNATEQLLQQKQAQKKELAKNVAELKEKIPQVEASCGNFAAALGNLETQSNEINQNLKAAMKSLPNTISLSSISYTNNDLTISGWTPSEKQVLEYLAGLDASGQFGGITTMNIGEFEGEEIEGEEIEGEGIEGEGMDFTLISSLQTQGDAVSIIKVALNSLPTAVSLTGASYTNSTLTINGTSPYENEILSYFWDLQDSGKFSEITITSMTRNEEGGMDFSLVLKPASGDDIQFAQKVFRYLASGDLVAEDMIDWENFKGADMDAGATYRAIPNEKEKADFRKSFIADFSGTFQASEASVASLTNWRIQARDSERITVASDRPDGKAILLYISVRDGRPMLSGMEIQ